MLNPFDILGIKTNASKATIRKAYKRLAMQHHPDRGGAVAKFNEIKEAYEACLNPKLRKKYTEEKLDPTEELDTLCAFLFKNNFLNQYRRLKLLRKQLKI